jgi:hypothetical protein
MLHNPAIIKRIKTENKVPILYEFTVSSAPVPNLVPESIPEIWNPISCSKLCSELFANRFIDTKTSELSMKRKIEKWRKLMFTIDIRNLLSTDPDLTRNSLTNLNNPKPSPITRVQIAAAAFPFLFITKAKRNTAAIGGLTKP